MLSRNPMVPRVRPLLTVGYKYNTWKVLSFIVTYNSRGAQAGLTCFYNYPEQFYNVSIHPVFHTFVMYKFFGSLNEVESHNKSRQSYLGMLKFWVNQCGWLRPCATVSTGMNITNFWKLFCYGFKIYHYENCLVSENSQNDLL